MTQKEKTDAKKDPGNKYNKVYHKRNIEKRNELVKKKLNNDKKNIY